MRMFTLSVVFVVMIFIGGRIVGQNLVSNGSFEDTVACPLSLTQIDDAIGWSSYSITPDYFNSCAPSGILSVSTPENIWGFQYPRTGDAYAGLLTLYTTHSNWREYIGIQLSEPLVKGQKYFGSFYVSRAVSKNPYINIATSNIGMRMSTIPYSSYDPAPVNNSCQFYTDSIISDTANWVRVSGSFIADSAYQYLSIGNFFIDSLTSAIYYDTTATTVVAYYYVDDVFLSSDSDTEIMEPLTNLIIKLSPNPASSYINIVYTKEHNATLTITNAYGIAVKQLTLYQYFKNRIVYVDDLAQGIYLVTLHEGNKISSKKMIVQR